MAEICRISVPVDAAALSANQAKKRGWRCNSRLRQNHFVAARYAWIEAGKPVAQGKVIAHLIVKRARLLDEDNLVSGCKAIIDGLFVNAITPNDSPSYFKLGHIEQQIKPEYRTKPEVVFIVEDL